MIDFLLSILLIIVAVIGAVIAFWVVILTALFVYFGYGILAELLGWSKITFRNKEDDGYE